MSIESEINKIIQFSEKREEYMNQISSKINLAELALKRANINFISIDVFDQYQLAWSPTSKRLMLISTNRLSKPLIEFAFPIREKIINEGYLLELLTLLNNKLEIKKC